MSRPLPPLTFVVQRAIKVVAARVKASGQLDEMASPRVASTGEAGESDELLRLGWEEPSVHAAIVCRRTDRQVRVSTVCLCWRQRHIQKRRDTDVLSAQ